MLVHPFRAVDADQLLVLCNGHNMMINSHEMVQLMHHLDAETCFVEFADGLKTADHHQRPEIEAALVAGSEAAPVQLSVPVAS